MSNDHHCTRCNKETPLGFRWPIGATMGDVGIFYSTDPTKPVCSQCFDELRTEVWKEQGPAQLEAARAHWASQAEECAKWVAENPGKTADDYWRNY